MKNSLEKLSPQKRKLIVTGETFAQTEQIIKELDIQKKQAQVSLSFRKSFTQGFYSIL